MEDRGRRGGGLGCGGGWGQVVLCEAGRESWIPTQIRQDHPPATLPATPLSSLTVTPTSTPSILSMMSLIKSLPLAPLRPRRAARDPCLALVVPPTVNVR